MIRCISAEIETVDLLSIVDERRILNICLPVPIEANRRSGYVMEPASW
jgi:hypothetical protein